MGDICVIGIGNTLMGDDGAGVRVAEEVRDRLGPESDVTVITGHMAGMRLMPYIQAARHVIFVDAMAVDDDAGSIFRMDPDRAGITGLRSTTSHGMGIPYLITNARMLGHHAGYVVYGIQVGDIMLGPDTLSPKVRDAIPRVAEAVLDDIERLRRSGRAAAEGGPTGYADSGNSLRHSAM